MKDEKSTEEDNYIGNIWGWKYSMYALYIILFFIALTAGRYAYLKFTGQYPVEYNKNERLINNNPYLDTFRNDSNK